MMLLRVFGFRLADIVLKKPTDLGLPNVGFGAGISSVITTLDFIAAIIAVFFLIVGAIRYAVSNADPGRINAAKMTIRMAILGLALTILAQTIVAFVAGRSPQ